MEQDAINDVQNILDDKKKDNKGMLIALILCLVLAVGGVGFGIWAIIDGNAQIGNLNNQIAALQEQNNSLSEQIATFNWATAELADGVFYVKDTNGDVLAQSNFENIEVSEIGSCSSSANNTIFRCTIETSEGEGWVLYDSLGDSLISSFDNNTEEE